MTEIDAPIEVAPVEEPPIEIKPVSVDATAVGAGLEPVIKTQAQLDAVVAVIDAVGGVDELAGLLVEKQRRTLNVQRQETREFARARLAMLDQLEANLATGDNATAVSLADDAAKFGGAV